MNPDVEKIQSTISQYLDGQSKEYCDMLLRRIVEVNGPDVLEKDDVPMAESSFLALLEWLKAVKPKIVPGIGMSFNGELVAYWGDTETSTTMTFTLDGTVSWSIYIKYLNLPHAQIHNHRESGKIISPDFKKFIERDTLVWSNLFDGDIVRA